ncbi:hypothetical protein ONZ45_g15973 [Pleurotus djamor]|nr:hypothetical protein ONZ45_g15973 [Pleurotus djamor]
MPQRNGFSAWISVEDTVAAEYGTRISEEEDKAECWIASEEGKHFQVHFQAVEPLPARFKLPERRAMAGLFLDGVSVDSLWCDQPPSGCFESICVSSTERSKLVFSALKLTDEESFIDVSPNAAYGTIQLEIWEVEPLGQTARSFVSAMPNQIVHETAKKAGVHCIGLDQPSSSEMPEYAYRRQLRLINNLATFSFSYQPLAVLQANEIAPRHPTPGPATSDPIAPPPSFPKALNLSDDDNESAVNEFNSIQDQMKQLQARLDTLSNRLAGKNRKRKRPTVKQEALDDPGPSTQTPKRIKQEVSKKRLTTD